MSDPAADQMHPDAGPVSKKPLSPMVKGVLMICALTVICAVAWTFLTSAGNPDPTTRGTNASAAIIDIAILVFREGLECILVLAAITASMIGPNQRHRKAVAVGAGIGAIATIITWFIAINIVTGLADNFNALQIQAWTGLLAIVVLLTVMNWFFHKIYWGGWISAQTRQSKQLEAEEKKQAATAARVFYGMGLLGFASFYREGFEVVLFLQTYNLQMGSHIVYLGALVGLFFAGVVAVLTFIAHHKLPYRKMLELTGGLLGVVLLIMVGEQGQEMQQAGWIGTTTIQWLVPYMPDWLGLWFSVFPTVETLVLQFIAAALVIGSFLIARRMRNKAKVSAPQAKPAP
ncbi:MAG: FTR1 family protein [Pseudomonadota bacterium]